MALRANVNIKKKQNPYGKLIKLSICLVLTVALGIAGFILYFNGQNVKAPLLKFLSERTSFSITCENVEFSPLYPNVLKLKNIKFNDSKIKEIYVEYDLKSIISSDNLKIKYFFAKDLELANKDIEILKNERFEFKEISIDKLDLVNTPLHINVFDTNKANLSAANALIDNEGKFTFKEGTINAASANLDDYETKHFYAKVSDSKDKIIIEELSTQMLGGTVNGQLSIDKESQELNFTNLSLSKVLLQDYRSIQKKYSINAPSVIVNSCVLALGRHDILVGQLSGKLTDLDVNSDGITFKFVGKAGEITKPSSQLTADENFVDAQFFKNRINLNLKGKIFNGDYSTEFYFTDLNDDYAKLNVNSFALNNAKVEPTLEEYNYLEKVLFKHNTHLGSASITNTEFVSNINELPLSIKSVTLNANEIDFDRDSHKVRSDNGKIDFGFDSAYYSDLFIKSLDTKTQFSDDFLKIEIPTFALRHSKLSALYDYDMAHENLVLKLNTKDFDISELNSGLFSRLFNGKLDLNVDLHSEIKTDRVNDITYNLKGEASIKSDSLLVSSFGLDLLNGGQKKNFELSIDDFIDSIKDGDCGIYELKGNAKLSDGKAKFKLSSNLTTSHVTVNGTYDLGDKSLDSKATLVSLAKDSMTSVIARGVYDKLNIFVTALSRGEIRPGINEEILKADNYPLDKDAATKEEQIPSVVEKLTQDNGSKNVSLFAAPKEDPKDILPPESTVIGDKN